MFIVAVLCLACVAYGLDNNLKVVSFDTTEQWKCNEVTADATYDCRWKAGLYRHADQTILNGTIAAYQLQWFSGQWSGWYVPGFNDIDWKVNPYAIDCQLPLKANSKRRVWSYFFDHTHKYIICKTV